MNNTGKLLKALRLLAVINLSLITGCAGFQITQGEICKEIPFIDAPEGYCATNTQPVKSRWVPAKDWAEFRVTALMISPEFYTEIKKNWLKACRKDKECVKKLETVDDMVQKLNKAADGVKNGRP